MANTFTRFPIPGGDSNVGALYNEAQLYGVLGTLSGKLYNDGGALKVPLCRIGIDNGLHKGLADIDTITAVSLAGCSNSTWLAVEMEVSGTVPSFTATDIAAATDPTIIPASVKAAWDGRKGGYYLSADKRLVGLAWLNSSGVLLAVVNFKEDVPWASQIGLHTGTIHEQDGPGKGFLFTGTWDMDTDGIKQPLHYFDVFFTGIRSLLVTILDNTGVAQFIFPTFSNAADPGLISGGARAIDSTTISLYRRTGGLFDAAGYNAATYKLIVEFVAY